MRRGDSLPQKMHIEAATPVEGLKLVHERMKAAIHHVVPGRAIPEVVAVSKTYDASHIEPLLIAGHRVFGENRVQEAKSKWPALRERYAGVELHLIGPLQSNKTREAVELFDVIETLDREKLALALKEELASPNALTRRVLIQVNTGLETQKAGIAPKDAPAFIDYCRNDLHLPVMGLMCIPPAEEEPSPHFALLATLARQAGLKTLSMGMSGDFDIAATLGATHVRVGSAIFGARQ